MTKRKLGPFLMALEKYLSLGPEDGSELEEESSHLERREEFCTKIGKEQWVAKLREKWEGMNSNIYS